MSASKPTRIAMWSGPRNISTAMMRSWSARPDVFVCDEPLYAHYLKATGLDHPGADEVMAVHETDWRSVAKWLTGPTPDRESIFYQKHMAHHLTEGIDLEWVDALSNAFLIREPQAMLVSLAKVLPNPTVEETGLPQQLMLFQRHVNRTGCWPPVVDSRDVLNDPAGILKTLCERLNVPFLDSMLSWHTGPRNTDGVWAKHWYHAVKQSTRFAPYRQRHEPVPHHLQAVLEPCQVIYQQLAEHRIV